MLMEMIAKRKRFFTAQRAAEQRSKPPTKAQMRNRMCTYLRNMGGYKHHQLKGRSYKEIQMLFDKVYKEVNSFVPMVVEYSNKAKSDTEQESSTKRAGDALEREKAKKQKIDDDQEEEELKKHMEIVKDDELVKAKHRNTKPEDDHERVLWDDLKVMFEPDIKSELFWILSNTRSFNKLSKDLCKKGSTTIDNMICQLGSAFALKYLGPFNYFLGIEIVPHVSGILISQKKYILELLQSAGLSNCNLVSSPMVTSSSLSSDDSTAFFNPIKYRQVVGSLQYVTLSWPDIAFAVNKVCQYMHAPTENHWSAVKRSLRYLHGTVEHGMLIRRSSGSTLQAFIDVLWKGNPDTSLEAFSDVDWARDSNDRRSTGGFAIYLGSTYIYT
ncbi:retrovirus-related pol polyprotein from transposon TNT 1-94 [Tanacetum coccineum]